MLITLFNILAGGVCVMIGLSAVWLLGKAIQEETNRHDD